MLLKQVVAFGVYMVYIMHEVITMDEENKTCAGCRHFYRHYVRVSGTKYSPLAAGHCGEPRVREKREDTPACHRYTKRPEPKGKG